MPLRRSTAPASMPGAPPTQLWVVADDAHEATRWCQALSAEGVALAAGHAPPPAAQAVALHCGPRLTERLALLRELRALDARRPLLAVAPQPRDLDQVLALEMGADDVIDSALAAPVVAARLRALLRRCTPQTDGEPEQLCFGRLRMALRERAVCLGDECIDLTECEFEVLWLLARNAGRAVSRGELLQRLRGLPYQRIDRSIDCRVFRLRAKLRDGRGAAQRIRTVRNCGYLFSPARW